jgi:hypothetical protein
MRFVGLVLLLIGLAAAYFLGYLGLTVDQARARLAQLLNLPGLAPPTAASSSSPSGTGITSGPSIIGMPAPIGQKTTQAAVSIRQTVWHWLTGG